MTTYFQSWPKEVTEPYTFSKSVPTKPKDTHAQYLRDIADIESNTTKTHRVVTNYFGTFYPEKMIPEIDQYKLERVWPNDIYRTSEIDFTAYLSIHYEYAKTNNAKITFWKIV